MLQVWFSPALNGYFPKTKHPLLFLQRCLYSWLSKRGSKPGDSGSYIPTMNRKTSHPKSPTASLSAPSGPPVNWWSEMISHNGSAGDQPRALMWRWRLNHHTSEHATGIYWNLAHCDVWNVVRGDHEYCVFVQYFKTIIRFGRKCSCEAGTEEPDLLSIIAFMTWLRLILGHVSMEVLIYTRALWVVSLKMKVTLLHDGTIGKWCVLERL